MMGDSRRNGERQKKMQPFRVLEHTADVGFEAFGATREEVFANAASALMYLMVETESVERRQELPLRAEGSDLPSLLVNWLSEVVYLCDAESWLFRDFAVDDLTDHSVVGKARGEKFDRKRHQLKLLVKAITYHQLDMRETGQGWRAQVYVDI
jgi:SHS2 domain-containing protein